MPELPVGARGTSQATFRNQLNQLADPTTVRCEVKAPGRAIVTPDPLKVGTGVYEVEVDLDVPGRWYFRWEGTGAVVAATPDYAVDVLRTVTA